MKRRNILILMAFLLLCVFAIMPPVHAIEERWSPAEAGAGGFKFLTLDRPATTWTYSRQENSPAFVHFFRLLPKSDPSVWFDVRMMGKPVRAEFADATKLSEDLQKRLAQDQNTISKVVTKSFTIDGAACEQLSYLQKIEGNEFPVLHTDILIVIENTWFMLQYEAPPVQFRQYRPVFEKILKSFKVDREKLKKFWESIKLEDNGSN